MNKRIVSILKNNLPINNQDKEFPLANGILMILTIIIVFVVPVLPKNYFPYLNTVLVSGIFFSAAFSLKKHRPYLIGTAFFLTTIVWLILLLDIQILSTIIRALEFIFFMYLVTSLIIQVSQIASVTLKVIIDSITGYLLLGFAFNLIVTTVSILIPNAYNINLSKGSDGKILTSIGDYMYYSFVTFTTTGYGDILPIHPISKSLSVLISVSGQLYLAIIIAMLVGKYSSSTRN